MWYIVQKKNMASSHINVVDNEKKPQSSKMTEFSNLNDDCKRSILKELDLESLLNIVDSNSQFYSLACQVFKAKCKNRRIAIDRERGNRNAIHSPLATLKLLRNFGELISDLQINFALFNIQFCKILEQYLATYCSVSLNFLTLSCNPTRKLFDNIVIPFENVYSIKMESCCFLRSKISYREFFPRLRYLQVDSTRYETRIITNTTIPSIRSLAILDDFEETEISELLKLNSQIEKLLLVSNYSSKLIRRLNNILPNLYCLCLHELPDNFFMDSFEVIQLNNIRVFSMSSTIRLRSIPFEFTKLEHLSILAPLHLNTKWLNQFENMDNLKSIGLFDITGNITGFLDLFNIQRLTDSMNICYKDEMPTRCVDNILILMSSPHPPKKVTITSLPPDFEEFVHNFPIDNSRYDIISYAEAKQIAFKFFSF